MVRFDRWMQTRDLIFSDSFTSLWTTVILPVRLSDGQVPPQAVRDQREVPRRIWHRCQAYFKAKVRELYVSRLQIAYKFHMSSKSLKGGVQAS